MRQNLSFNLVIEFCLNAEGTPENIKVIRSLPIFELSDALECIQGWRFSGFEPDRRFVVVLYWQHGIGWTSLGIQSGDYSHRVRLNLSQYGCLPARDSPTPAQEPDEPASPK